MLCIMEAGATGAIKWITQISVQPRRVIIIVVVMRINKGVETMMANNKTRARQPER